MKGQLGGGGRAARDKWTGINCCSEIKRAHTHARTHTHTQIAALISRGAAQTEKEQRAPSSWQNETDTCSSFNLISPQSVTVIHLDVL